MKHTHPYSILLLAVLFWFMASALLAARDPDEAKELVTTLRQFLAYDPGTAPQGADVTPADIQARKNEIQAQITAVLQSTRKTYTCRSYNFTVNNYVISKGALSITDDNLNHTMWIKMTQAQGDAVTRNPDDFWLEAQQELDENFNWKYYNWVLKGSSTIYYEEQPEPVNTIPKPGATGPGNDPEADITVYYIEKDQPAQEAIRQFEERNIEASLEYFETVANTPQAHPEAFYWAAMNYISAGYPDTALMWLRKYLDSGNQTYATQAAAYYRILTEQNRIFVKSTVSALPSYLASTYGENHFVLSPDGEYLYFSAYREDNPDHLDIWRSARLNNQWAQPKRVEDLSTSRNEALTSFSLSGLRAYLMGAYTAGKSDYDIYQSDFKSNKWQKPASLAEVNSPEQDIDPWVHEDYLMFFSSNRPGGYGGYDLYYSLFSSGKWQAPVNFGPGVNSSGNECAPFLDWDGKTLFFCSDGYNSLGGSDLYKVVILDSGLQKVSLPENLGAPINSAFNELRFYHSKNSNLAMLISDRGATKKPNLYSANLVYSERGYYQPDEQGQWVWTKDTDPTSPLTGLKPLQAVNLQEITLSGKVTDDKQKPLVATLDISWSLDGIRYQDSVRSNRDGTYSIPVPALDSLYIESNLSGYRKFSWMIKPDPASTVCLFDVQLEPLEVGRSYVYEDILFLPGSAVLRTETYPKLMDLAQTLLSNTSFKVEISGHTATNEYSTERDLKLSQDRAETVMLYLQSVGVAPGRMIAKGYGRNFPKWDNATDEGQRRNRRVEFKILEE